MKCNKIASDIKLVFYSSTITKMHGLLNIRFTPKICFELHTVPNINCKFSHYSVSTESPLKIGGRIRLLTGTLSWNGCVVLVRRDSTN